jgi:hypothetical protein
MLTMSEHGLHLALLAERAHALHFLRVDRVVDLVVRHGQVAHGALLLRHRGARTAARAGVDELQHAGDFLHRDHGGRDAARVPVDHAAGTARNERDLVDRVGERDQLERVLLEDVEHAGRGDGDDCHGRSGDRRAAGAAGCQEQRREDHGAEQRELLVHVCPPGTKD